MKRINHRVLFILILITVVFLALLSSCGIDDEGQETLSATLDSNHKVLEGDSLDGLKPYLVVTYKDNDGKVTTVTDYVLSGELVKGQSKITIKYNGAICEINVTVGEKQGAGQIKEYTVTFKADGEVVDTQKYAEADKNITVPPVPEKHGYIGQWENFVLTKGDMIVKAVYTARQYVIILNYDGATEGDSQKSINVTYNQQIGELPTPTKTKYGFVGWAYNGEIVTSSTIWTTIDNSATFVAQWERSASEGLKYTLNDDMQSYSLTGLGQTTDTEIVIASTYNGKPVTKIGVYAFFQDVLTSVIIPNTVTTICSNAFSQCRNLVSVVMSDSVTSIESGAFSYCSSLTYVTVGNGITSIDPWAFDGCGRIHYNEYDNALYLGNESNPYVILMKAADKSITSCSINNETRIVCGYAFSGCKNLTNIVIPDSIIKLGMYAFSSCTSLANISIGKNVVSMEINVFSNCSSLESIVIPNSMTLITPYAFSDCINLSNVVLGNSVVELGQYAFSGCSSLESIVMPDSVTTINSNAFSNCSNLSNVTLSDSTTFIGRNAFSGCDAIYNEYDNALYLGNDNNPYLVLIRAKASFYNSCLINEHTKIICPSAFYDCGLSQITIPNNVKIIGENAFAWCIFLYEVTILNSDISIGEDAFFPGGAGNKLTRVKIPTTAISSFETRNLQTLEIIGGESIDAEALSNCSELVTVIIGDSVKSIGDKAFYGCTNLTNLTMADSDISIGTDAFSDCDNIKNVVAPLTIFSYIPKENVETLEIVGRESIDSHMFSDCKNLSKVTIGKGITTIESYAFSSCTRLNSVIIGDDVISIGHSAFYLCSSLQSLTIPDSVTTIDEYAFCSCKSLKSITIPDRVSKIGRNAFSHCSNLIHINVSADNEKYYSQSNCIIETETKTLIVGCNSSVIPSDITTIGASAFMGSGIRRITIPDSVTTIDGGAFAYCENLTIVIISNSVKRIVGDAFFQGIVRSRTVYYKGTPDEWANISYGAITRATCYYYSESEPKDDGNYWHYDDNGEIVIWIKE